MKSLVRTTIAALCCFSMLSWANGPRSAKQLGVNWASMTDRAQIELQVDRLLHARYGLAAEAVIHIAGQQATAQLPEGSIIHFRKEAGVWQSSNSVSLVREDGQSSPASNLQQSGFSAGHTFKSELLSDDLNVQRLTRQQTRQHLDRRLFAAPEQSVSYYRAIYRTEAPFVSSTFIQLVIDREWNRVMYGSLDRWIKAYEDILRPAAIAISPDGRVFVSESGRNQVVVLQIHPDEENTDLQFLFAIEGINNPGAIAHHDNGTPLNAADDYISVVEASSESIIQYALQATSANEIARFDDFSNPNAMIAGRINGANNQLLYVVDDLGRRVRAFSANNGQIVENYRFEGQYGQYFTTIKTDHFGNIYLGDAHQSQLFKLTADLQLLDQISDPQSFRGLASLDIPFGQVTVEGEGTYWTGFDQLFTLERWSENSGAQRHTLGLAIRNANFSADAENGAIENRYTLTDAGEVTIRVLNAEGSVIRTMDGTWMNAGERQRSWDRRDDAGQQVEAGVYQIEIEAASAYSDDKTILAAEVNLPAFYWQNSGSDNSADDAFRVQGQAVVWDNTPSQTASQHSSAVIYRFNKLNPASEYQIALEFFAGDGITRTQQILVDGVEVQSGIAVNRRANRTSYITIPAEALADGQIDVAVREENGQSAVVSQVWLKETGASFSVQQLDKSAVIPSEFALEQNYPNPFNPTTTIRYHLSSDSDIRLEIFNTLGQRVRVLADQQQAAGSYSRTWDGRNSSGDLVSSGVYFYRLSTGDFVQSRRMLLLK